MAISRGYGTVCTGCRCSGSGFSCLHPGTTAKYKCQLPARCSSSPSHLRRSPHAICPATCFPALPSAYRRLIHSVPVSTVAAPLARARTLPNLIRARAASPTEDAAHDRARPLPGVQVGAARHHACRRQPSPQPLLVHPNQCP